MLIRLQLHILVHADRLFQMEHLIYQRDHEPAALHQHSLEHVIIRRPTSPPEK